MPYSRERLESNLCSVRQRIADAASRAQRSPDEIALVAVTKTVGLDEVRLLAELGVTDFGENRPELCAEKIRTLKTVRWHMIGSVQRRKARDVVELFDAVDSVDRLELAEAIEKRCEEAGKVMPVLLEVNVSGEESKHGFLPEDVEEAVSRSAEWPHLKLEGLMTMAPFVEDPEQVRPVFRRLRQLAESMGLKHVSMGMTNDFEVAIEEGATQVRIGSALFE